MKKSIIIGMLGISMLGLTACGNSANSKPKSNPNEFKLLNADDTRGASNTEHMDSYALDSDNSGKATYKYKLGKNISLKLKDTKYAKINRLSKNRTNIDMNLANKNDAYKIANLTVLKNGKKFRNIDLEIDNGIQSYLDKQDKIQEEKDKAAKQAKQAKMNAEYPEFANKFPAGVNGSSDNQLLNTQMRFTGKIYGLSADSIGDYMVVLKDSAGNLASISYDHSKTGKITTNDTLTVYGATNGTSHLDSDKAEQYGIPEASNKKIVLLSADKITKE